MLASQQVASATVKEPTEPFQLLSPSGTPAQQADAVVESGTSEHQAEAVVKSGTTRANDGLSIGFDQQAGQLPSPPATQPTPTKKEERVQDKVVKVKTQPAVRKSDRKRRRAASGKFDKDEPPAKTPKLTAFYEKRKGPAPIPPMVKQPGPLYKKPPKNTSGITLGRTPYPRMARPTPDECREVLRRLEIAHPQVKEKLTGDIPPPSPEISGCGEVNSTTDALLRTVLAATTSTVNSGKSTKGLYTTFGVAEEGIGKDSINWRKVHQAVTNEVFEAIKVGGLGDSKARYIKGILDVVWKKNQEQRAALLAEGKTEEVAVLDADMPSLEYIRSYTKADAFDELCSFNGVGPKTAACVVLFCLRTPCFAVDTHVFRLCTWLGWLPSSADEAAQASRAKGKPAAPNEIKAFAHLDVRIPDDLKHALHQYFWEHGRVCVRCNAASTEKTKGWEEPCVLEDLLKRVKKVDRKANGKVVVKKGVSSSKAKGKTVVEEELSESELPDLDDSEDELEDEQDGSD
jgi:endonuclease III